MRVAGRAPGSPRATSPGLGRQCPVVFRAKHTCSPEKPRAPCHARPRPLCWDGPAGQPRGSRGLSQTLRAGNSHQMGNSNRTWSPALCKARQGRAVPGRLLKPGEGASEDRCRRQVGCGLGKRPGAGGDTRHSAALQTPDPGGGPAGPLSQLLGTQPSSSGSPHH